MVWLASSRREDDRSGIIVNGDNFNNVLVCLGVSLGLSAREGLWVGRATVLPGSDLARRLDPYRPESIGKSWMK